jgi:hypothetical protein
LQRFESVPALTKVLPLQIKTDEGEIEVILSSAREVGRLARGLRLAIIATMAGHHANEKGSP